MFIYAPGQVVPPLLLLKHVRTAMAVALLAIPYDQLMTVPILHAVWSLKFG